MAAVMAPATNGVLRDDSAEVDFYKKLALLRDEVTTGRHPRYKFRSLLEIQPNGHAFTTPDQLAAQLARPNALPTQRATTTIATSLFREPSQDVTNGLFVNGHQGIAHMSPQISKNNGVLPAGVSVGKETRSPHTAKAKVAVVRSQDFSRQRARRNQIERAIKDNVAREYVNARARGMEDLIERGVLASVVPRSAARSAYQATPPPADHKPGSAASDVSYYSSRGASWTPEASKRAELDTTASQGLPFENATSKGSNMRSKVSGLGPSAATIPGLTTNVTASLNNRFPDVSAQAADNRSVNAMEIDDLREESYSPPAADAFRSFGATDRADQAGSDVICGFPVTIDLTTSNQSPSHSVDADNVSESDYSPPPPAVAVPAFGASGSILQPSKAPAPQKKVKRLGKKQKAALAAAQVELENKQAKIERKRERREAKAKLKQQQQADVAAAGEVNEEPVQSTRPTGSKARALNGKPTIQKPHELRAEARRAKKEAKRAAALAATAVASGDSSQNPHDMIDRRVQVPLIKQESITPPSFREPYNESRRVVLNDDGTVSIVTVAPQDGLMPLTAGPHKRPKPNKKSGKKDAPNVAGVESDYADSPDSDSSPRTGLRRDNVNLRKVATMQNASRPQPQLRRVSTPDTWSQHGRNLIEETSHTLGPASRLSNVHTNPALSQQHLYQPQSGVIGVLPPIATSTLGMMAPPPPPPPMQRILRDEHGNEYIAIPRASISSQSGQTQAYSQYSSTSPAYPHGAGYTLTTASLPQFVDLTKSSSPAVPITSLPDHGRTYSRYEPELSKKQRMDVGYASTASYVPSQQQTAATTTYPQAQATMIPENSYVPPLTPYHPATLTMPGTEGGFTPVAPYLSMLDSSVPGIQPPYGVNNIVSNSRSHSHVIDLEAEGSEYRHMMPPPPLPIAQRSQIPGSVRATPAMLPQPVPQSSQLHRVLTMPPPTPVTINAQYSQPQFGQSQTSHRSMSTHPTVIDLEHEGSEYRQPSSMQMHHLAQSLNSAGLAPPPPFSSHQYAQSQQEDTGYNPKRPSITPSMSNRAQIPGSVRMQSAALPHQQQSIPSTQSLPFVYPHSTAQYNQPQSMYNQDQQRQFPPPPPPWPSQSMASAQGQMPMMPPPPPPPPFLANWPSLPPNPHGIAGVVPSVSRPGSAFGMNNQNQWGGYGQR